ncbi:MAG: glycerol-3-phosphate dehydrogenase [Sphingomonas sp.]
MTQDFDVLVVGGGINGAAIARDAAGRGAHVLLVEKDDLASHTSSASTKLIHGGLRYLEHYEFRLVAESLAERERLARAAPHLIRGLRFVLPHDRDMRPKWLMRVGLFLYDRLGGRSSLPKSGSVDLRHSPLGAPLKPEHDYGFVYSDCWGDDSRLVVANARDAADRGARIETRTRLVAAARRDGCWDATIVSDGSGMRTVRARVLVNATGSWAADFLPALAGLPGSGALRLVKGSHIVTRRLYDGDHAYMLQNKDRRIIFVIPYEEDFTLIGTTDVAWQGPVGDVVPDGSEIEYLCSSVSRWFADAVTPDNVVASFAGLRPLYDDDEANPSEVSRDYVLALDDDGAPVLSVFGGKLTTHRALGQRVVDMLAPFFPEFGAAWTSDAAFPGGDIAIGGLAQLIQRVRSRAPFLDARTAQRMVESYGTRTDRILGDAANLEDLGEDFGEGLTQAEIDYLVREEWAMTAEDILWRRSKLGLRFKPEGIGRVTAYLNRQDHKTLYA